MSRVLGVMIVAAMCAGCHNPTPVYDPFMGRTTVPPPGTAAPMPSQPYYAAPPGSALPPGTTAPPLISPPAGASAAPPRTIGPSNFAPSAAGSNGLSSTFTPNVSPISQTSATAPATTSPTPARAVPGALPASPNAQPLNPAPSGTQPSFGLPGGGMSIAPAPTVAPTAGTPTLAQPPATQAAAIKSATWEAADGTKSAGATSPVVFNSSADKNPIRIVAPPPGAAAIAATPKPATPTLNQSLAGGRVPEITDLPPANVAAKSSAAVISPVSASQPSPAATSAAPTDPNYGYDPQYRWLKGKLEYSQSSHSWRLRYIPPDGNTDNYGGSVVLADNSQLSSLHPGDAVYVQGSLGANSANQSSYAPMYNLQQIQKL